MKKYTKEEIEKVINESPDMISALEAVGAMYGIPSTNMMAQPGLKTIRVEGDTITAPADAKPNTKAIVCAIGAVLDQISQRVNDKLDNYQSKNIVKGQIDDKVSQMSNPSKGKVISHHTLSDGSEIIVYDSGLVDMPHTDEARMKIAELRANGEIPEANTRPFNDAKEYVKPGYFSKEDDIALTPEELRKYSSNDPTPIDIADEIDESDMHLEMCARYGDTDHLGYDIFQEMGFDFIRITESFVNETAKNKKNEITSADIKHMKFDNKEITKAIQCFNIARNEQSKLGKGKFDIKQFIEHPKYKEGVRHLENQFDCQLAIWWRHDDDEPDSNQAFTGIYYDMLAQKLTISKSKGFQLGGLPIQIHIINKAIDEEMTKKANTKLFGQFMCATLCHEIFHNIANALRLNNGMFAFTLTSAMSLAEGTDDIKKKRAIFNQYALTLQKSTKGPINALQRKKLVDDLCKASAIATNAKALNELQSSINTDSNAASAEIDRLINALQRKYDDNIKIHEKLMKKGKKFNPKSSSAMLVIGVILTCTIIGMPIGIPMILNSSDLAYAYMNKYNSYLKNPNKEEYYCDLFAAMYNLPISFTIGEKKREYTANDARSDAQLQKLVTIESKVYTLFQSKYPTLSERNHTAYTTAKNILDSGVKLPKEYKEYCDWIVKNYSRMEKTDIDTNYRSQSFDPNEAKDLDKHLQNLIDNNNIALTK